MSFEQYNVTFGQYLNTALHDAGDCLLNTIPFYETTAVYAGLQDAMLDFSFLDPGNFACLTVSLPPSRPELTHASQHTPAFKCLLYVQSQFGIMPVASIARIVSGAETYAIGASVIARADDTQLQSLSDTAGRKVLF